MPCTAGTKTVGHWRRRASFATDKDTLIMCSCRVLYSSAVLPFVGKAGLLLACRVPGLATTDTSLQLGFFRICRHVESCCAGFGAVVCAVILLGGGLACGWLWLANGYI